MRIHEAKVCILDYNYLPDWVNRKDFSDGGHQFLVIEIGEYKKCYSDSMKSKDATFLRDLSWVSTEILKAFAIGYSEAELNYLLPNRE